MLNDIERGVEMFNIRGKGPKLDLDLGEPIGKLNGSQIDLLTKLTKRVWRRVDEALLTEFKDLGQQILDVIRLRIASER